MWQRINEAFCFAFVVLGSIIATARVFLFFFFAPVISRGEVNESAGAAPPVLSHIWPRSHHIVFPEHCRSSGTACDRRKLLRRRSSQKQTGNKKACGIWPVSRLALENSGRRG